jgi:ABC-type nickel/cobalt efflux system permease component RcnA
MTPGLSSSLTLMASAFTADLFASVAATDSLPSLSTAYALKDLTVSGLLLVGIVVLYRELGRERRQNEEARQTEQKQNEETRQNERRHADEAKAALREFIKTQSEIMLASANKQAESSAKQVSALEEVVSTLGHLQAVSAQQIKTYDQHIELIVKAATAKH